MSANDLIKQIRANLDALAAILDPYNGGLVYPAAVTVDIHRLGSKSWTVHFVGSFIAWLRRSLGFSVLA